MKKKEIIVGLLLLTMPLTSGIAYCSDDGSHLKVEPVGVFEEPKNISEEPVLVGDNVYAKIEIVDGHKKITVSGPEEGYGRLNKRKYLEFLASNLGNVVIKEEYLYLESKFGMYWGIMSSEDTIEFTRNIKFPADSSHLFRDIKAEITLGDEIDVSEVTNMVGMFCRVAKAHVDFSKWNTSNVENMACLFDGASELNPDVSKWDTSNVKNMSSMFASTKVANPDVSNWDTSNVENMSFIFHGAEAANPDVSNWDVSSVTNMRYMFCQAKKANPDVSNWNIKNVSNMSCIFEFAEVANPDVSKWDTSNVTDMSGMFAEMNANPDVSNWDTSNVKRMSHMFRCNKKANPDVSKWDTSNVGSMLEMFEKTEVANPDVSNWDTSKVECTKKMFKEAKVANPDVSRWDVSNVDDMSYMFYKASNASPDVSRWNLAPNPRSQSGKINMSNTFIDIKDGVLDLSNFDADKIELWYDTDHLAGAYGGHSLIADGDFLAKLWDGIAVYYGEYYLYDNEGGVQKFRDKKLENIKPFQKGKKYELRKSAKSEVEIARDLAKDKIKEAAKQKINEIKKTEGVKDDSIKDAIKEVLDIEDQALETLDGRDNIDDINKAKDDGIKKIENSGLDLEREKAKAAIEEAAKAKSEKIDKVKATEGDTNKAKNLVNKAKTAAMEAIDAAGNVDDVKTAAETGKLNIKGIELPISALDKAKDAAKAAIEEAANAKSKAIDEVKATEGDTNKAKDLVNKAKTAAIAAIDAAGNVDAVKTAEKDGKEKIDAVKLPISALDKAKKAAKAEIEEAAKKKKNEINAIKGAIDTSINDSIKEVEEIAKAAKESIDNENEETKIEKAKNDGIEKINNVKNPTVPSSSITTNTSANDTIKIIPVEGYEIELGTQIKAEDLVKNKDEFPGGTKFVIKDMPNIVKPGAYKIIIASSEINGHISEAEAIVRVKSSTTLIAQQPESVEGHNKIEEQGNSDKKDNTSTNTGDQNQVPAMGVTLLGAGGLLAALKKRKKNN